MRTYVDRLREAMAEDPNHRMHGTSNGYLKGGCRCDRCTNAGVLVKKRTSEYFKRWKKELASDPYDPRHGTSTGYRYGCRCEECKKAESEEKRLYYKRKVARQWMK